MARQEAEQKVEKVMREHYRELRERMRRKGYHLNPNILRDLLWLYVLHRPSLWYPYIAKTERKASRVLKEMASELVCELVWLELREG